MKRTCLVAAIALAALTSGLAHAAGVDPTQANDQQRASAQQHFLAGRDAFGKKDFAAALAEYKAAFEVVASPNARLGVARSLAELGKLPEAYVEYTHTIDDANALAAKEPKYKDTAGAAAQERAALEQKIGLVSVQLSHAPEGAIVKVGGADVDPALPVPVMPGTIEVAVEAGGKPLAHEAVPVAAGEKKTVALEAQPAPATAPPPTPAPASTAVDPEDQPDWGNTKPPPQKDKVVLGPSPSGGGNEKLRPFAYVAGGVGVAGLVTFLVAGLMEKSTYSGLQDACHPTCPADKAGDISSGRTQETIANIGLGVGLVGLAAGTVLYVLSIPSKRTTTGVAAPPPPPRAALVVSPQFVGVRGSL